MGGKDIAKTGHVVRHPIYTVRTFFAHAMDHRKGIAWSALVTAFVSVPAVALASSGNTQAPPSIKASETPAQSSSQTSQPLNATVDSSSDSADSQTPPSDSANSQSVHVESSNVNGARHTSVTVNGQNVPVPSNGSVSKTINNGQSTVHVNIDSSNSSTSSNSSSSNVNISSNTFQSTSSDTDTTTSP